MFAKPIIIKKDNETTLIRKWVNKKWLDKLGENTFMGDIQLR